jgi:DNA-binding XRE family transcriptional regulator
MITVPVSIVNSYFCIFMALNALYSLPETNLSGYDGFMNGKDLKTAREKMGLTQAELAEKLGVATPLNRGKKISEWERDLYRIPPFMWRALEQIKLELKKKKRQRKA